MSKISSGSLRDSLKNKEVIPFIGAGVSRAIMRKDEKTPLFPSWWEFLSLAAERLEKEGKTAKANIIKSLLADVPPDYLDIAQRSFDSLGVPLWNDLLMQTFKRDEKEADEKTLELAQLVWQLGSNLVFTTNIDDVLEWKSVKDERISILDTQTDEFAELQRNEIKSPILFYLHGRVTDKRNIVFTRKQYEEFYDRQRNKAKLGALVSFLTRKPFLFIGFSLEDPYFVEQLKYIHEIYGGAASRFYVLLRKSEIGKLSHLDFVTEVPYEGFREPLLEIMREMRDIAKAGDNSGDLKLPPKNPEDLLKSHFNVPFPSKGEAFVGRVGMIEKIWESLSRDGRAAIGQAVSIEGFGGLGKTQLAVEYSQHFRDRYENGVYWLTADENLDSQLIKIGENLSWISAFDKGFDQAELVRNRFRKLSDCLVVFDNVDDQNAIKDYLPERNARQHLLITSRELQDGFYPINLNVLSIDEARALLIQIAERQPETEAEKEALENILKELDGLPLAVELVGGYLLRLRNISFQEYYQFLQNEPLERIEKKFSDRTFTEHNKSIIRTLQISERLLNETRFLEDVLDILAWSGKSSMGYSLLRELVGTTDNFALKNALGVALELRFIKQEENTERYAIHRLLARVRRHEKPLEQNQEWHRKIVQGIERWFEPKIYDFNDLVEFEAEIAHLNEWQEQTFRMLSSESVLLTALRANPLHHRGDYQKANNWLTTAYQNYQQESLDNRKLLADLKNFLGVNYSNLGNHQETLKLHKQALEMRRELFGEKHPKVAISLNNLGSTYTDLGNNQEALRFQQQALEMQRELFGDKHPKIAMSLNYIGLIYDDLGKRKEALECHNSALIINRELLGNKHPDTILTCFNLISVLSETGGIEKAVRLAREFLSYVPPNHPDRWFFEKHAIIHSSTRRNRKKRR